MWRIRLGRELPRYALTALSLMGLLATARLAIAPPRAAVTARPAVAQRPDVAAEAYAQLFARSYLTWEGNEPEAHQRALARFVGPGMESGAGLQPPPGGEQRVLWTEVAQERTTSSGGHIYTIAAQTDSAGLAYLAVGVGRAADGALQLTGYPALVGGPAAGPPAAAPSLREVRDRSLQVVVERALRNYMDGSSSELAADLTADAHVSLPAQPLNLLSIQRLVWSAEGGGAVNALLQAEDARGARYTLAYELEMARVGGRWEVGAIEMDPDA
jgi:hypothetical protein